MVSAPHKIVSLLRCKHNNLKNPFSLYFPFFMKTKIGMNFYWLPPQNCYTFRPKPRIKWDHFFLFLKNKIKWDELFGVPLPNFFIVSKRLKPIFH
jgi:hypothetical protein